MHPDRSPQPLPSRFDLAVDVAVVGAGTAGLAAYRAAVAAGRRAVIIEGGAGGTTCAREGCMPSKLLLAAAHAAHHVRDAHHFGVHAGPPAVHFHEVMARVRSERDRFVGFVLRGVDRIPAGDRLSGFAAFLGRAADGGIALRVSGATDTVVHARVVVLATGSRDVHLPFEAALGDRVSHAAELFEWTTLPARTIVFGPGAIGLELGQALNRLGSEVEIVGLGGLLGPLSDPRVREVATAALQAELSLDTDAGAMQVSRDGDEVVVTRTIDGVAVTRRYDHALVAVGRRPNLDRLDVGSLGLSLDRLGRLPVDPDTLQVGDLPLFVAGDAAGIRPLLHEAADEGRLAGANAAAFPDVAPGTRRSAVAIVFSDPQLAVVGDGWADLEHQDVVVGAVDLSDQGRSRVMRENRGWLQLYADRATGRIRGAELAHPRAEHLAHQLAWLHQLGLTVDEALALPFYHPVVEEGLRTALRDAAAQVAASRAASAPSHPEAPSSDPVADTCDDAQAPDRSAAA